MITEPVLNLLLFCKLWAEEENLPVFYTFYRIALATCRNPDKDRPLLAIAPLAWYSDVDGDSPIGKRKREKDERLSSFHFAVGFIIKSRGDLPKKCAEPLEKMAEEAFSVMAIEKNRFREWCLASGYQLPWFWFSEEEQKRIAGQNLVEIRHKEARPSHSAINEIVAAIQKKEAQGDYWHQITEIKAWLERNPKSKTTLERLKLLVNRALNADEVGIPPKKNAPRKE